MLASCVLSIMALSISNPSTSLRRHRNLVILGAGMTGKTALALRFASDRFDDTYEPTYETNYTKHCHYKGQLIDTTLTDTQGMDSSDLLRNEYALGYHGYMLVYSVTSVASFAVVKDVHDRLVRLIGTRDVPRILVGNKTDVGGDRRSSNGAGGEVVRESREAGGGIGGGSSRQVTTAMGAALAAELGIPFIECSAKLNHNVDKAFTQLLDEIDRLSSDDSPSPSSRLLLSLSTGLSCGCCLPDMDSLHEGVRWERSVVLLISCVLVVGLVALCCSVLLGLTASTNAHQLLAYVAFALSFIAVLLSLIGLFGIRQARVEYLRVYGLGIAGLAVGECAGYGLMMLRGQEMMWVTWLVSGLLCALLCVEVCSACVVWCYAGLLKQSIQSPYPSTSYQALW